MNLDSSDFDDQDQSEVFDEDNLEGADSAQLGGSTLEEIPDVYDVTSRLGDAEDLTELDAADFDDGLIDDEDLEEEDEVIDDDAYAETDEEDVVDHDIADRAAAGPGREVDLEFHPDVDGRRGARGGAGGYESRGVLDDEDIEDLGYGDLEEEEEEEDEEVEPEEPDLIDEPPIEIVDEKEEIELVVAAPDEDKSFASTPLDHLPGFDEAGEHERHARPADAPFPEDGRHDHLAHRLTRDEDRQEALVDEAVEETFPASDPISPKHIT